MKRKVSTIRKIMLVVLALAAYLGNQYLNNDESVTPQRDTRQTGQHPEGAAHDGQIDDAGLIASSFKARQSNVWVQAGGEVIKLLSDDNEGSRHQRFLVRLNNGQTILIAHNIDLAPKIPVQRGDTVEFRGEYEWNDKGGVVHWTHHDPSGRKAGGWISHRKRKYQ